MLVTKAQIRTVGHDSN